MPDSPGPSKPVFTIRKNGRVVTLELTCQDEYAAIEVYDQMVAEGRRAGLVDLLVVDETGESG
jgi:hypothetical protein